MLSTKKLLYKIVDAIHGSKATLSSSNWTAGKATWVEGYIASCGAMQSVYITVKATQAMSAGSEYTLGTLKNINLSSQTAAVGTSAKGTVSLVGGEVRFSCFGAISSGVNIYIRLLWLTV